MEYKPIVDDMRQNQSIETVQWTFLGITIVIFFFTNTLTFIGFNNNNNNKQIEK